MQDPQYRTNDDYYEEGLDYFEPKPKRNLQSCKKDDNCPVGLSCMQQQCVCVRISEYFSNQVTDSKDESMNDRDHTGKAAMDESKDSSEQSELWFPALESCYCSLKCTNFSI